MFAAKRTKQRILVQIFKGPFRGLSVIKKGPDAWVGAFFRSKSSASEALPAEGLDQRLAESGRRRRHLDAGGFHGGGLGTGVSFAAGDDCAGMAHAAAGGRGDAGNEARDRLPAAALGLVLDELGGVFLGRAADLADHDDRG